MIEFVGYAPDLPPETPGVLTACDMVVPYPDGYRANGSALNYGGDALAGEARGFSVIRRLDNSYRTFAATQTAIYELNGTSWVDISDTGGYDLGGDTETRARFAQFGNVTIAAVGHGNELQASTTGSFAAISGAPKAKIVETVNNFVFAFNFDTSENGWQCSALGDETDWTPSVATQSVAGSFIETPGPVMGAKKLGSLIVAYKDKSAFLGQYVGVPLVWSWTQLPGEIGAASNDCIVNIGTAHFFISQDDFQMFDGSRFTSIGAPVRQSFFSDLDPSYRSRIQAGHDRVNSLVYWFYPSRSGNGKLDKCIVYNYKTNKWGRADTQVESVAEYIEPGITYDSLGSVYSTYDDLPTSVSFNSSFWTANSPVVAFFKPDHKIYTFAGTPGATSITTGHFGDITQFSTVSKIRPRFLVTPASSTMEYSHSNTNADQMTQNLTSTLTNNVYDLIWSARWHKFKFNFVGAMTMTGFHPHITPDGHE